MRAIVIDRPTPSPRHSPQRGEGAHEARRFRRRIARSLSLSRRRPFGRRLKRARGARIPVTIVTGFLGAGKTTLVRRFLAAPEGEGTAVVINEFGSVGIDDALVRGSTDEVTLLGNGCLCCNTRSDLQVALRNLVAEREHGTVPRFKRIVIETSGLADPGPILQTFATDRALGGEFHVEVVVAMVDAMGGLDTLEWSAEARKQVILADRLVVSKTDLAKPAAIKRLTARLRALNPRAVVHTAVDGELDPRCLLEADAGQELRPSGHSGFVAEAEHSDGIVSFVLTDDAPLPVGRLRAQHGDADCAARSRSPAREGLPQRRGLPRAGRGARGPAPRPSAGRARGLAGQGPHQPARFHHAQYSGEPGARPVGRRARLGTPRSH